MRDREQAMHVRCSNADEIASSGGDIDSSAPVSTAASFCLFGAGRRKPWPLAIEHQQPEVRFELRIIEMRRSGHIYPFLWLAARRAEQVALMRLLTLDRERALKARSWRNGVYDAFEY
jgi:hypothetical protein